MDARRNVVDFATYRLVRDLRRPAPATEPADAEQGRLSLSGGRQPAGPLTDRAAAHRARMLLHLSNHRHG